MLLPGCHAPRVSPSGDHPARLCLACLSGRPPLSSIFPGLSTHWSAPPGLCFPFSPCPPFLAPLPSSHTPSHHKHGAAANLGSVPVNPCSSTAYTLTWTPAPGQPSRLHLFCSPWGSLWTLAFHPPLDGSHRLGNVSDGTLDKEEKEIISVMVYFTLKECQMPDRISQSIFFYDLCLYLHQPSHPGTALSS